MPAGCESTQTGKSSFTTLAHGGFPFIVTNTKILTDEINAD